jgi:peptidoglycan/xylan/chitin deacetylase (PgdA/CDA1 family)
MSKQKKEGILMKKKKRNMQNILIPFLAAILFITSGFFICLSSIYNLNAEEVLDIPEETTASETFNPITDITVNHSSITITKGKKSILKASVKYGDDTSLKNETYVWTSKNTSIATVSENGKVKAVKSGKTYIICSSASGNIKARCKVIVCDPYNPVKTIKLDKDQIRLNKADKRTLTPTITYANKKRKKYAPEEIIWSSSNNKVATVNQKGIVTGKSNGSTYIKVTSKYTNKTVKCKVTVQKTKYIAITFDDGPGDYTDALLDALKKYHSKATFFVLGNRVSSYQSQLKREYNLGMEIGSHTYSHKNLNTLSKKSIISEITKTESAIKNIIGTKPTLLRPPYGNYNETVSKYAGVPMIYWSVDTEDWKHKNASYVKKTVINSATDGAILLLHDIHQTSVQGVIKALPTLRKNGYEMVTTSELYAIKGKKLKNGVMYYGPNRDK